jgi:hypothetical protein
MENSIHYTDQKKCAHAWAHGLVHAGKSGNFYFIENTIYSYGAHFPIATLIRNQVYFTLDHYKQTTAKHKCLVRSAISHKEIIFVRYVPVNQELSDPEFVNPNLKYWTQKIEDAVQEYTTHPRRKSLLVEIDSLCNHILTFLKAINILPSEKLQILLNSPSLKSIKEHSKELHRTEIERERKKKAILLSTFNRTLSSWKQGKTNSFNLSHPDDSNLAYLRWNETIQRIETTKGVVVPFIVGQKFWEFIQSILPVGCNSCNYKILDFHVQEILPTHITVGCHKILMAEVIRIAKQLDWSKSS